MNKANKAIVNDLLNYLHDFYGLEIPQDASKRYCMQQEVLSRLDHNERVRPLDPYLRTDSLQENKSK